MNEINLSIFQLRWTSFWNTIPTMLNVFVVFYSFEYVNEPDKRILFTLFNKYLPYDCVEQSGVEGVQQKKRSLMTSWVLHYIIKW